VSDAGASRRRAIRTRDDCWRKRHGRIKAPPASADASSIARMSLPTTVRAIAWKAQLRLTGRFKRLVARGQAKPKVATAIARELTGFIWAIAREVPPPA
jgi:transposase